MIKYLKTRWKTGVLALLMVAVTAGILFLYDIPLEPVGYVAVFEMLLTGLGLMWDYHKYRKKQDREQRDYIAYIDEQYNSERLTNILTTLTDMIGAKVLNIARQDYDPQGASVTILIAEGSMVPAGETQLAHLDKSHVTVHTYPEYHPETCLATFRVDIDVATCGEITPLSTLDYLIGSFDSDIITMDYRVRGFTRDLDGKKLFLDHDVVSIQHYIDPETLRRYDAVDINVYEANLFHTKMMVKDIDLQNYLFNTDVYELPPRTRLEIMQNLRREMIEIFSGRNIY